MKKLHIFRLMIACLVLLLPLAMVSQAYAGKPVIEKVSWDASWPIVGQCDFDITVRYAANANVTSFFDEGGNLVKQYWQVVSLDYTFSANNKQLNVIHHGPEHLEVASNGDILDIMLGTEQMITIPGYGVVHGSAGQLVLRLDPDTFEVIGIEKVAGNYPPEDWTAICAYLGG